MSVRVMYNLHSYTQNKCTSRQVDTELLLVAAMVVVVKVVVVAVVMVVVMVVVMIVMMVFRHLLLMT